MLPYHISYPTTRYETEEEDLSSGKNITFSLDYSRGD